MRVCFLFQRRFAYIAHHLAVLLKEKHPEMEFCGYVFLRESFEFLQSQKEIPYRPLILDEDSHKKYEQEKLDVSFLNRIEKEYGLPNLWPYIALDRVLMFNQLVREYPYDTPRYTHEEMLRIFQVKVKALLEFFEKEKPDAIVLPNIGGIGVLFMYHYAKKHGIRTLLITTASTKNRFVISETYDRFTGAEEIFKRNLHRKEKNRFYAEAKEFLERFRKEPEPYHDEFTPLRQPVNRAKQLRFLFSRDLFKSLRWFAHLCYMHIATDYRKDYSYIHPLHYLIDRVKRKTRNLIGVADLYDAYDPTEDFVFFPLHYEPEVSLLLLAPFATDQREIIRRIARSLPVTYKLYVKEHPLMVPFRPRSYYRQIKKNPNVKLINPLIPSAEIIRHTKLITTITGSSAWEGLMFKKPAIVFGDQFYNGLSMVKKSTAPERLPYLVKEQLEHFRYNEEELLQFIAAILEDSASLDLFRLWEKETDEQKKKNELRPLAELLAKKLGLQQT